MAGKTEYKNKWIAENLDQIRFTAPKGTKDAIKQAAQDKGFPSVNAYLLDLVKKDMEQ